MSEQQGFNSCYTNQPTQITKLSPYAKTLLLSPTQSLLLLEVPTFVAGALIESNPSTCHPYSNREFKVSQSQAKV